MARIRYIKPEFFEDETVAKLPLLARLLYIGLFCHIDRSGVIPYSPSLFKAKVFPHDELITSADVANALESLIGLGRFQRFEHCGKVFLFCPKFKDHQLFHHTERAKYSFSEEYIAAQVKNGEVTVTTPLEPRKEWVMGNGQRVMGNGELGMGNTAPDKSGAPTVPVDDPASETFSPEQLREMWNTYCGPLPKAERLSDSRRSKAKAQIHKYRDREHWLSTLGKFQKSRFCQEQWKPGFDDFLNETKRIRALEGSYDDKDPVVVNGARPSFAQQRQANNLALLKKAGIDSL